MVKNDYMGFCSILARDTLYLLSSEAYGDGFIDELVAQYLDFHSDNHCESADITEKRCPNGKLPSGETRRLSSQRLDRRQQFSKRRKLLGRAKAGAAAGAAAAAKGDDAANLMKFDEFVGVFAVHISFLILGILIACLLAAKRRWRLRESGGSKPNGKENVVDPEQGEFDRSSVCGQLAEQRDLILKLQDHQSHQAEMLAKISAQLNALKGDNEETTL